MFAIKKFAAAAVAGVFALGAWSLSGGAASAAVLVPGGSSTSLTGTYSVAGETYVTSQTKTYNGVSHDMVFDFSLTTTVYNNPNTGGDDFLYQLTNTGPNDSKSDSFDRLTLSSFLGYSVDADYQSNTGMVQTLSPNPSDNSNIVAGDVAPDEVDRSTNGAVVGYTFPAGSPVAPQEVTDILIVRTDSSTYHMGSATVIDSTNGSVVTEVPFGSTTVPEPGSLAMIAISLGMLARRRRSWS
ncbi:MAG: PEP-CTERM sorting domain-containing protein [Tepidisphaeraceae bacterium]|jgi:hypothetical protein